MAGSLLDANLLCLLAVGRIDPRSIARHPRLNIFDQDDFHLLGGILDRLGNPVFCPHVLAETSNLLGYRQSGSQARRLRQSLADLVAIGTERSEDAASAVADTRYLALGLTDAVLLLLARDRSLGLVSDDLALCLEAERRGLRTINYNYVRDGALRIDQL